MGSPHPESSGRRGGREEAARAVTNIVLCVTLLVKQTINDVCVSFVAPLRLVWAVTHVVRMLFVLCLLTRLIDYVCVKCSVHWARELSHDFWGTHRTFHLVKHQMNKKHQPQWTSQTTVFICLTQSKEVWVMALIPPWLCLFYAFCISCVFVAPAQPGAVR